MKKMIAAMVAATLGLSTAAFAQAVPPAPPAPAQNGLMGTGLGAGAAGGILAGLIVVGVIVSDDNNSGTTTTTTN